VAGLAIGPDGALLLHPGWEDAPLLFTPDATFLHAGFAFGGPFGGFANYAKQWHSLSAKMHDLPKDAHVSLFVYTTNNPNAVPAVTIPPDPVDGPFPRGVWSAGPPDLERFLIDRPEHTYAWVGIHCVSEGASSPTIEQIRLDFDRTGYIRHLPAIYRDDASPTTFLTRYLALAEQLFNDVEAETDALLGLLDPAGAPIPFHRELARWLGLDISPDWDEAELRDAIAAAYIESADRGTVRGLRATLRRYTGTDVAIEEPIQQASWWALSDPDGPAAEQETSLLGVSTHLVSAEPQGAVLGSTAIVDNAHLISGEEYGVPLFEGLAHRFMVRIHQGAGQSPERLSAVSALIEREKPAHTDYDICVIAPGMSIGIGEGRIGIDMVLGGDPLPSRMGGEAQLGVDTVLGGALPGQIGERSEIGVSTLLGPAAVGD
jgi:phage tail-like protein